MSELLSFLIGDIPHVGFSWPNVPACVVSPEEKKKHAHSLLNMTCSRSERGNENTEDNPK